MADCKELVISDSTWSLEFTQNLLPSAERADLPYHLSYLHLGSFPELEHLIRERALETQQLFRSSEAILLKCVSTSHNLVSSLFPKLKSAVEMNKPTLAVRYMEKARSWIDDTIRAMDDMVKRYEHQNRSVAMCTSDVFQEQKETEKQQTQHSEEMKSLEEDVAKLEEEFRKNGKNLKEMEKKMEKNLELQNHIKTAVFRKSYGMAILSVLVPFVGPLIKSIYDTMTTHDAVAQTQALNVELSRLTSEKSNLQNKQWDIVVKLTDLQLQLATSRIQLGVIPSPILLEGVQQCLSRIQQILVQLRKFCEKVRTLLDSLKDKTFVKEDLIEDLKEEFLTSVEATGKHWQRFGECCQRAQGVFGIQSKDAYKFLKTSPSSLSKDEWKEQYESVMEKLKQISPQYSSTAAITE
ncbi:uncharacterized protein LOC107744745 [Sinocyclocheilus rhinocerous]|uniref:uncharacterized protein LOC107744745 n=1 Tax=Sinocyclocheilus rhinocerous TaxID=307959 RepID=UPI0007B86DEC|nr:PREDICTED: uncharacterized protein LOC107744745 [Sinocyclocheilus rhinocerous]